MRRAYWFPALALLCACTGQASRAGDAAPLSASATPAVAVQSTGIAIEPNLVPGPGGMTLRQEVGAVIMAGFTGPLTPAVVEDWRERQFGGLFLADVSDAASTRNTIGSLRAVMLHPLLAATQADLSHNSSSASAVQSEMAAVATGLKGQGFDIDLAPNVDTVAAPDVSAAIAGIHSAGVYAAANDLRNQNSDRFKAAIDAHVELIMVDAAASIAMLRSALRFQGIAISSDLGSATDAPTAAIHFLQAGGDMLLVSGDIAVADAVDDALYAAVMDGTYRRSQLDASVQKLLNLRLRYMP